MDTAKRDTSKTVEATDWQEKTKAADKPPAQNNKQTPSADEMVLRANKPQSENVSVRKMPQATGATLFDNHAEGMSVAPDNKTLKGIVTDQNSGQPLAGAIVKPSGSGFGAVTNANGRFVLRNVPDKKNLEVRYIGYIARQVKVNGSEPIKISLQPIK